MPEQAPVNIELYYFDSCPSYLRALDNLKLALRLEGFPETVELIRVDSNAEAQSRRFLGSPSIRIDGVDIEGPNAETKGYGYGCRVYHECNGIAGWPSVERIRQSLRQASQRTGNERAD